MQTSELDGEGIYVWFDFDPYPIGVDRAEKYRSGETNATSVLWLDGGSYEEPCSADATPVTWAPEVTVSPNGSNTSTFDFGTPLDGTCGARSSL